jgi:hypothetical protein
MITVTALYYVGWGLIALTTLTYLWRFPQNVGRIAVVVWFLPFYVTLLSLGSMIVMLSAEVFYDPSVVVTFVTVGE